MDINKKYIIIFGTLILLLVVITGIITYYKEKETQTQFPIEVSNMSQDILSFSQNHPINYIELSGFIGFCKNAVFSDVKELKDKEIKETVCIIGRELRKLVSKHDTRLILAYIPSILPLDSIDSFKAGRYIGISIDAEDVVRKYDPSLLEEDKLYFCSISEPSLVDPLILQLQSKYDLFFDGGNISCSGIKMDETSAMIFLGFVPDAESLNIKQYLVDEQTVSKVLSKQSFSEMKGILNNYPITWQMEKPINL